MVFSNSVILSTSISWHSTVRKSFLSIMKVCMFVFVLLLYLIPMWIQGFFFYLMKYNLLLSLSLFILMIKCPYLVSGNWVRCSFNMSASFFKLSFGHKICQVQDISSCTFLVSALEAVISSRSPGSF